MVNSWNKEQSLVIQKSLYDYICELKNLLMITLWIFY